MSHNSELDTLAREIVRQHSHLALQANPLQRLPMDLTALPTLLTATMTQAVYAACCALDFIDADAQCVASAWQRQSERSGHFDANAWPTDPQDFGQLKSTLQRATNDSGFDSFAPCPHQLGLYAVLPDATWVGRMARAGVPTVQLRFKSDDPGAIKREVQAAVQAVQGTGALLFINDHWREAIAAGAYGVHLGQEDLDALKEYQGDAVARFKHEYGLEKLLMDRKGLELLKALFLDPQMSISGFTSGYQGPEDMTIVPAAASAKLDIRIVPDLTVDKVHELLRKHLDARGFNDIKVVRKPGYEPAKTSVRDPYITLVHSIMKEACDPAGTGVVPMAQGSGPAFLFAKHAPLCMSYSYADLEGTDCHAPNENMKLESLPGSMAVVAAIVERLASAD